METPRGDGILRQEIPSSWNGYKLAWGRGILLMMEEAAKAGLPEPALEEYAGGIQVTFLKSSTERIVSGNRSVTLGH